ncbi:hypothetical protein GGR56DRAFT_621050 [Xylariaceae sp. FL0804]|nr:hypothetical protein GGR56DRAFT_621050 [Xylariaceae sp. FL0804]
MVQTSLAVLAAFSATSMASPVQNWAIALPTLTKRDNTTSTDCSGDTSTTDGVAAILDNTGAVDWLDIMFTIWDNGESEWLDSIWDIAFPDQGKSPLSGCGEIGSDCVVPVMCQEYSSVMSYWVIASIGTLHSKINTIHSQLLWDGFVDSLSIDQIADDFSTPAPDNSWISWVSSALGIASGAGLEVNGMVGLASAAFGAAANIEGDGDVVDTTSVENTLANIMQAAGDQVASILSNATGHGDSSTLPIFTSTTYQFATSRFLNDPTILFDEDKDKATFFGAWDNLSTNLKKKLVNGAMFDTYFTLLADTGISSSDDCTYTGAQWLSAGDDSYCFYLTLTDDTDDCSDNDPSTCDIYLWETPWSSSRSFSHKHYTKLTDTYGFDLASYYAGIIDCQLNGDGTVDTDTWNDDSATYRCYYNLPMIKGEWKKDLEGRYLDMAGF